MTGIGKLVIMGGSESGIGNTSPWAEFNFRCDPEAAEIILANFQPNIVYLVSWVLTLKYVVARERRDAVIGRDGTAIHRFLRDTWATPVSFARGQILVPDPLAAFVACYPDRAQSKSIKVHVVLHGEKVGMSEVEDVHEGGINLVTDVDFDFFIGVLVRLGDHHPG